MHSCSSKIFFKKYLIFLLCQAVESFSPFLFFQLRLGYISLLSPELAELGRKGHSIFYFPQQVTTDVCKSLVGRRGKCQDRNFDPFPKITETSPMPHALCNVTLSPPQQEVEST